MAAPPSTAERDRLAQKHLRNRATSSQRTLRQRARLSWLQRVARRYSAVLSGDVPPRRILVVRPDHLGDLLFATPALHWLRRRWPAAHIAALVGPWGAAALAANPDVDQLLTCPFPGFTRQPKGAPWAPYRLLEAEAERLRAAQFDWALVLRFDHWWGAWLAAAAGIPVRVGYDIAEVAPFLTRRVAYVPGRHEVVQNLALMMAASEGEKLSIAGAWLANNATGDDWRLRFSVNDVDTAVAQELLSGLADRPLVAIHPGSGAAVKRWRTEAWADLATQLAHEFGVQVIFTGSAGEAELIAPVLALLQKDRALSCPPLSLAGQTSLGVLAAVYQRCALVIGPDSGPLHLAVAVGTPTIHLYGPVDQRTFGPWGSPHRHVVLTSQWACIPCNRLDWPDSVVGDHGCVRDIAVAQVLAEAGRLLASPAPTS